MKKAVLSLSGGMDSTCLLIHLLANDYEVRCYSFDYGQKHIIELERVKQNIEYLKSRGYDIPWSIINLKSAFSESSSALVSSRVDVPEGHYADENMKATVVENRNAIFSSIVYGKALAWANQVDSDVLISLGIHSGDHQIYPDCRPESRDALAKAFKISNWGSEKVDYYTPYLNGDKYSILEDTITNCMILMLDFDIILANTNTCYNPNERGESCGKCGSCTERLEAFEKLGLEDPVKYAR